MIKIRNYFKNRLNSFILLPLLLTNLATPGLINKPLISETLGAVLSLNFQISKSDSVEEITTVDNRGAKIDAYFAQWDLPLSGHGDEMVLVADKYDIDWTLLPALAMLETTGGKNLCSNTRDGIRNKNAFGYGSCAIFFKTYEAGFDSVAKTISGNGKNTSHLYADKTIDEILEVYNPPGTPGITDGYHDKAIKVMSDIENMNVDISTLAKA